MISPEQEARIRQHLLDGKSVTATARELRCSDGTVRKIRDAMGIPAKPNGNPISFSQETKRLALQLAANHTIGFASAQTGLSAEYISHLRKPTCRVKGFEGGIRIKKSA